MIDLHRSPPHLELPSLTNRVGEHDAMRRRRELRDTSEGEKLGSWGRQAGDSKGLACPT